MKRVPTRVIGREQLGRSLGGERDLDWWGHPRRARWTRRAVWAGAIAFCLLSWGAVIYLLAP